MPKSHSEKVISKVGKRPQSATQIAKKLGFKSHQPVARALGEASAAGRIVKTDKGYQQA